MINDVLQRIWPEWEIEKQLGRGSYGVVYKAVRRDHNVESHAAIKVISIPSDSSEIDSLRSEGLDLNATRTYLQGIVDDFVSEIQLMESLKGVQNIVSVEDYKVVEKADELGWDIFIRMELLTPFNSYICDRKFTEKEVIKLGCDICTALEICGKRSIIHRDIKPENIFINDFGDFKLGDFGIARKLENMTGGLSQKGTFYYMAPEVANSNNYDAKVDTYSLGIVLYRLLNGNRLPFLDTEKQLLNPNERRIAVERRMQGESLPAPCNASPAMADLILRACAFDPNQRFASATEMKQALLSVSNGTYQIRSANFDQTISVRRAPADYGQTTSVRKAPAAANQKANKTVDTFADKPKKSRAPKIIAALLAVIILVGAGAYFVPKYLDRDAGDAGDVGETIEDVDVEGTDGAPIDDEQIEAILSEADELAAAEDYEGALGKVKAGLDTYPESESLQAKADEYSDALAEQVKQNTLSEAASLADSGDYVSAMELIETAQDTHGEDAEYQAAYDSYNQSYIAQVKDDALTNADSLAQQGEYIEAINIIEQAIATVGEDDELASKAKGYEGTYVSDAISQVDTYIASEEYDKAEDILNSALKEFPKNEQLQDKNTALGNAMPQALLSVCPPYEVYCSAGLNGHYEESATLHMAGQTYMDGFYYNWSYMYSLFNLNGKYETLEFDVGHIDGEYMTDATVTVYLDGKESKVIEVKADELPQHIVVPIDGASQMKIEMDTENSQIASYGFANLKVYNRTVLAEQVAPANDTGLDETEAQDLLSVCPPYEVYCSAGLNGHYEESATLHMAGQTYMDGFYYNWSYMYSLFNLNGKYETLEFDVGHIDGEYMTDATVTVYLDGKESKVIEVKADELPQHIVVPIDGASQMKIEMDTENSQIASYGFANLKVYVANNG